MNYPVYLVRQTQSFCPPNPKEFDKVALTPPVGLQSRACPGMWSRPQTGSTSLRFAVGGIIPVSIAFKQVMSSTAPAAWIRCPSMDLTEEKGTFIALSLKTERTALDSVLSFS